MLTLGVNVVLRSNMLQMSFEEAVRSRRSVRGFLDRPVPQDVMEKVFGHCSLVPFGYEYATLAGLRSFWRVA